MKTRHKILFVTLLIGLSLSIPFISCPAQEEQAPSEYDGIKILKYSELKQPVTEQLDEIKKILDRKYPNEAASDSSGVSTIPEAIDSLYRTSNMAVAPASCVKLGNWIIFSGGLTTTYHDTFKYGFAIRLGGANFRDWYLDENDNSSKSTNKRKHLDKMLVSSPASVDLTSAFTALRTISSAQANDLAMILLACLSHQLSDKEYLTVETIMPKYELCMKKLHKGKKSKPLSDQTISRWDKYDEIRNDIFNICCTDRMLLPYFRFNAIYSLQKYAQHADGKEDIYKFVESESGRALDEIPPSPLRILLSKLAGESISKEQNKTLDHARSLLLSPSLHKYFPPKMKDKEISGIPTRILRGTSNVELFEKYVEKLEESTPPLDSDMAIIALGNIADHPYWIREGKISAKDYIDIFNICSEKINNDTPVRSEIRKYWRPYWEIYRKRAYRVTCTDRMLEIYFRSKILINLSAIANKMRSKKSLQTEAKKIDEFIKQDAKEILKKFPAESPMELMLKIYIDNPKISEKELFESLGG